jgi:hypothetical protein
MITERLKGIIVGCGLFTEIPCWLTEPTHDLCGNA